MSYYAIDVTDELSHHGILGMKWGVRRYQNEDGSLTSAGRIRYYGSSGKARHYKDVMNNASKNHSKVFRGKEYRNWVKEDPRNRTGQRARFELMKAEQALGGKKGAADAKYAYEHKRLAKYINRDGSLTTAGKLKYWDTSKARGQARMQRDIERDKNSPTTSEKIRGNARNKLKTSGLYGLGAGAYANRSLITGAILGRQKDPTKYVRKNARDIGKYALRSGLAVATGRPIAAVRNLNKAAIASTYGVGKAAINTAGRLAANNARAAIGGAYLAKEYGTAPGRLKQKARNAAALGLTSTRNMGLMNKAHYNNLEKSAAVEKKRLDAANRASDKVASTARNAYNKVEQTVNKKRKRN